MVILLARNSLTQGLLVTTILCIATSLAGCEQATPSTTVTTAIAPNPTPVISPISPTPTTDVCITPSWNTPWTLLSYDTFHTFGATSGEIDEQLISINPQWRDFRQTIKTESWTAGDIFVQGHGAPGEYGVNPSVLVVTVGMELEWQTPSDGDLYSKVAETGKALYAHYQDYYTQEDVRNAYPQIGNASTYSLYAFFDYDLTKLETWRQEYDRIFGELQPRINTDGC